MSHGTYSKYIKGELAKRVDEVRDAQSKELQEEQTLLRALVARATEMLSALMGKDPQAELQATQNLRSLIAEVRQTAESISKIEERHAITPAQVEVVLSQIVFAVQEVCDGPTQAKLLSRLRNLRLPVGIQVSSRDAVLVAPD